MPGNIEAQAELILNEIITADQKEQAAQDVSASDAAAWNSARLSIQLIKELDGELEKTAIRIAVADLYGLAESTIRRRELVARLIPPGLVSEHPNLTFSYWQLAARATHLPDPLESALDIVWMIERETEYHGKRPSVRTVASWLDSNGDTFIKTVWRSRAEGLEAQLDKIYFDKHAPQEFRTLVGWIKAMLLSYLETGTSPLAMGTGQDARPGMPPPLTNKIPKGGDQEN